eukprot:5559043-Ditylum_brightwellii.AAC.1
MLAEIYSVTGKTTAEKALKSIINAEQMKKVRTKIGHADKKKEMELITFWTRSWYAVHSTVTEHDARIIGKRIETNEWEDKIRAWNESTMTSPLGKHLGYYKALLSRGPDDPHLDAGKELRE